MFEEKKISDIIDKIRKKSITIRKIKNKEKYNTVVSELIQ